MILDKDDYEIVHMNPIVKQLKYGKLPFFQQWGVNRTMRKLKRKGIDTAGKTGFDFEGIIIIGDKTERAKDQDKNAGE